MYSTKITEEGSRIEVVTDEHGPYKTLKAAWLAIMIAYQNGIITYGKRHRAKNNDIALWIEVNMSKLPADTAYDFCSY